MKRIIAAITTAATLATTAAAGTYVVPENKSRGGASNRYLEHVGQLNIAGEKVVIDRPVIASASTFYLLANEVCISPKTKFKFHGPRAGWTVALDALMFATPTHGMSKERRAWIVDQFTAKYNQRWPGLGDWYKANAAQKFGVGFVKKTGLQLHNEFGIPLGKEA